MFERRGKNKHRSIGLNDPVYSGRNIKGSWDYVIRHGTQIEKFFEDIDIPRDRLLNENEWFNMNVMTKIWRNYRACLPDYHMHDTRLLTIESTKYQSYGIASLISRLSSIKFIIKWLPAFISAVSKIDLLKVLEVHGNFAIIEYRMQEKFKIKYLDSSFTDSFYGVFVGIPLIQGLQPANVEEIASCLDVFKKFSIDFKAFGHVIEEKGNKIFLDGASAGQWITIGDKDGIHPIANKYLKGERVILWEKDVLDRTKQNREVTIARNGELYNCSRSIFLMHWQKIGFFRGIKNFFSGLKEYLHAFFTSRDALIQQTAFLREQAVTLEERIEERTKELKRAQSQLIETEKRSLEHRITGGFAHEMRNALTGAQWALKPALNYQNTDQKLSEVLKGTAGQLIKEINDVHEQYNIPREEISKNLIPVIKRIAELSDILTQTLTDVSNDIERGLFITSQIREYAQLSELKPGTGVIDIGSILKQIRNRFDEDFKEYEIRLDIQVLNSVILKGEAYHFESIFDNLIRNAIEAFKEEKKSKDKRIDILAMRKAGKIEIQVKDTGPGIDEQTLLEIFEPFFSTKPTSGTGLGLSVVSRLVSLYGGEINVESKMGEGTTLTIQFLE